MAAWRLDSLFPDAAAAAPPPPHEEPAAAIRNAELGNERKSLGSGCWLQRRAA
jgi:hypothetical protein